MLSPKRVVHRKQMKQARHLRGVENRGTKVNFGDYGLMSIESKWITNRQFEAARFAMTRYLKRGGKVWIRIFPDKPLTKKPAEVRMGSGKGNPEYWVCSVKPGRILFEMNGVTRDVAFEAFRLAGHKFGIKTRFLERE